MRQPLTDVEIAERLAALPGWETDGGSISKTYALDSYVAGLALAVAIGTVCEGLDHHPEITIGWRKVRVSFTTHDAGNKVTAADFNAAAALERIGYPKKQ